MVAIVTGKGTGLERGSAFVLGSQGQLGNASLGRDGQGVYVNAANGNLVITRQDEFLMGLGPDVSINRTYNSQATWDGDNNDDWQISSYRRVHSYGGAGTTITRTDWDGSETLYTWDGSYTGGGAFVAKDGAGAYDTLKLDGTTWTWTDGNTGAIEEYDTLHNGRLKFAKDLSDHVAEYFYDDPTNRLTSIKSHNSNSTTADDETITFTYSGANLTQVLTTTTSGSLTRIRYGYETYGAGGTQTRLTSVTVDLTPEGSSIADNVTYVTTYAYADTTTTRVAAIRQQDGSLLQIGYDESGRVSYYTQTVSAGVTRTTSFDYSMAGRTIVTDAAGLRTALYHDAEGNLTGIAYPPDGNGVTPRTVQFTYNANGDVTKAIYGSGNVVTYSYDAHGNCILETDSAGNSVERTYSPKNELLRETRYPDGSSSAVTSRYVYDDHRRLRFEVSAEGHVIEHRYDSEGRRTVTIAYSGTALNMTSLGPTDTVSLSTMEYGVSTLTTKAQALRTDRTYDFRGNLSTVTTYERLQTDGSVDTTSQKTRTTYTYDQAGNLKVRTIDNPDTRSGQPATLTETFLHDGLNRITVATDFYGKATRSTFLDRLGQTVVTYANGLSQVTTFNRAGEIVTAVETNAGGNLIDLQGWPGNSDNLPSGIATIPGWHNYAAEETQWETTIGPDGIPVAAIRAGQTTSSAPGGGNHTNQFEIDASKAYEFTYYFKFSDLNKHTIYFGLSQGSPAYVETVSDGVDEGNPYFYMSWYSVQDATFSADKWYKVVGYVLPQGAAAPAAPLGGVYDAATGEKVAATTTFRWNSARPDNSVHSRFFNYYNETVIDYSSYFYQPEVRQVSVPTVTGPDAQTTQYRYDNLGRLRLTVDPTGRRQFFLYDTANRRVAEIDNDGTVTEYRYDGNDNVTSTTRYKSRLTQAQLDALADTDRPITLGPNQSSLLTNGSFDTSGSYTTTADGRSNTTLPGWTPANGAAFEQIASGNLGVNASNGAYWLDMDSLAGGGGYTATGSNLLSNNSFDTSGTYTTIADGRSNPTLPGWTDANGNSFEQITSGNLGVNASNGAYWLDMDSRVLTGYAPSGSNLLSNGSFDTSGSYTTIANGRSNTSLPGWTDANGRPLEQITSGQLGVNASNGAYWLDMDSLVGSGYTATGSNLLTNGSFETSAGTYTTLSTGRSNPTLPGWTDANGNAFEQVTDGQLGVNASNGTFWLDLDGVSTGLVTTGPNLVQNGSFETSAEEYIDTGTGRAQFFLPGWGGAKGSSLYEQVASGELDVTASDGDFWLDLDGYNEDPEAGANRKIFQSFNLLGGSTMVLKFDHASRTDTGTGSFEVYWNGSLVSSINDWTTTMTTETLVLTAAAGTNVLEFKPTGTADQVGASLDNVRLYHTTPVGGANMDISQTVTGRTAGEIMEIRFDHSNRTSSASGSFEVYWNNTLIDTIISTGATMQAKTYQVAAVAGNNTLRFKGVGTVDSTGASLDNVRLFATTQNATGGNNDISQTVTGRTAGEIMQIQFDTANRTTSGSGSFEVYWNGTLIDTVTSTGTTMTAKSYQVTALAGNNTLRFKGLGTADGAGASLDNVRLFATAPVYTGGNMDISQTVGGRTAGEIMQIQFDHANRTTSASGSFEVYWNNTLIDTITSTGTTMQGKTYQVAAVAGNNALRFKGTGTVDAAGASLDNVRVYATTPNATPTNVDFSQSVGGLEAGEKLQLKFDHANRTTSGSGSFEVYWNGTLVATINSTGTTMVSETLNLVAIAGSNTLRFKGTGTADGTGASLDNVRLFSMKQSSAALSGIGNLRPETSADDLWTFNVYDNAQRLVQTVDGTGATTVFTYDGASRLTSSRQYATRIAAGDLATLKAREINPNQWTNYNGLTWAHLGNTITATTLNGADAYKVTVGADGTFNYLLGKESTVVAGDVITYTITLKEGGPGTMHGLGLYGNLSGFGTVENSSGIVISGPGSLSQASGGYWYLYGLSTTEATQITVTRRFTQAEIAGIYTYVGNPAYATNHAGDAMIMAAPSWNQRPSAPVFVPVADGANDRVTRTFYDKDGRLTGMLDAEGYLTQTVYDAAGQRTKTIGYADPTSSSLWPAGDFAALLASVNPANDKNIRNYFVYDARGYLRATVDGEGSVTRMDYDASGGLSETRIGKKIDLAQLNVTRTVAEIDSLATGAIVQSVSVIRDGYGNVVSETRTLTGSDTATTLYDYDDMYRLETATNALGETVTRRYDLHGNVIGMMNGIGSQALANLGGSPAQSAVDAIWAQYGSAFTYDEGDRLVSSVDPNGNRTLYYYDADGRLGFQIDALGTVSEYRYDSFGRSTDVIAYATRIAAGTLATMKGGDVARIAGTVAALGNVTSDSRRQTAYDVAGRVSATRDALGHVTLYRYNAFGELKEQTSAFESGLVISAASSSPLVADGSFEAPEVGTGIVYHPVAPGLTFASNAGIAGAGSGWGFAAGPNGDQVAFVQSNGTGTGAISQTVTGLAAGNVYNLSFYLAKSSAYVANTITVSVDGVVVGTFTPGSTAFEEKLARFQAVSDTATITFTGTSSPIEKITALDQVQVSAQPSWNGVQTARTYDRRGLLKTEVVDAAAGGKQITTTYGYDAFGRAITLTNALTRVTTTDYDRAGRAIKITDALGHETEFDYDARGNLTAVTNANDDVTRHVYDKAGREIATIDARGGVVTSTYDDAGRVIATRAYYTRLDPGLLPDDLTEANFTLPAADGANDHVTRVAYDADGRVRFTLDGMRHVVENVYDDNGNVIRAIAYDAVIDVDVTGDYSAAYIADEINGLGPTVGKRITRAVYDAADRLVYSIDALKQVVWSSYDAKGLLTKQVTFEATYDETDTPSASAMDGWRTGHASATYDRTTRAYYDNEGQLAYSVDALGYVTGVEYDALGNVLRQSRYATQYTASDSTTLADISGAFAPLHADTRVTQFAYDTASRLIETTDPGNFKTRLTLDVMGQITSSIDAHGTADASETVYEYDAVGRVVKEVRGHGAGEASTSWFFYDGLGQRIASVDPGKYLSTWTYDELGNLTAERHYAQAIAGTVAVDDTLGELQAQVSTGPGDVEIERDYDAFGRLTELTDARDAVIITEYDVLDRVKSQTEEMGAGSGDDRTTSFTYDNFGNVVKARDARGNDSFSYYDALGRVTRQVDAGRYVTDTVYTRTGQVDKVTRWANAISTLISIDEIARPADPVANPVHDAETRFVYNKRDELTSVTDAESFTESYILNAFGERRQVQNKLYSGAFNTTVTYTYNKRGLVELEELPISTKNSVGTVIPVRNRYLYDARGNRTTVIEADGAVEARTTVYTYDKLDRVTVVTHDAVTVVQNDLTSAVDTPDEFSIYDTRGNVIESIDAGGAHTYFYYDHMSRLIAQVSAVGGLTRYEYDQNGNQTAVKAYETPLATMPPGSTAPNGTGTPRETRYEYDQSNRLIRTRIVGVKIGEWVGNSYSKVDDDIVNTLEYDKGGNIIHSRDGRLSETYFWYDKLGRKIAQVDGENYLTTWSLDAEGNALGETRFARRLTSFTAPTPATPGSPPSVATHADDRTTVFEYDRNGRRITEQRLNVAYTVVNSTTGAWTDSVGTSTIRYTYNGLGQVLTKTVYADGTANGEDSAYVYDQMGRLIREEGENFTDYQGADVKPRTTYAYDGLNNVTSTRIQAGAVASDSNDRITTYTYGAGGRLASTTVTVSATENFTHNFGYDVAGRLVRDSYDRKLGTGGTITEARVTRFDEAGRVRAQTFARYTGSAWVFTDPGNNFSPYDAIRLDYNVFGEVIGRGVTAGLSVPAVYQEQFSYDRGGRIWKSNESDGVLRFFVYDAAGNRTLTLASTGADLGSLTLANYTASIVNSGDTNLADAVTTIGLFDLRNQQTGTIEPDRRLVTGGSAKTLNTIRYYNAFGEVAAEADARGVMPGGNQGAYTTQFAYNTMGRLIQKTSPYVAWTGVDGVDHEDSPIDHYGYDLAGRLVSVTDANGNTTRRTLLAGTGMDGAEALVTAEFHPDNGVARTFYDVFGDARIARNELYISGDTTNFDEVYTYDRLGRVISIRHRGNVLTDYYSYDGLGQRIGHHNSYLTSSYADKTDYDAKGRVVKQVDSGGDTVTYSYLWDDDEATTGMGATFGAWVKTTVNAANRQMTEKQDYFGHTISKTDYGNHVTGFTYDRGGRLTSTTIGGQTTSFTWLNTGLAASVTFGSGNVSSYSYDRAGNRITETTTIGGVTAQSASVTYDALNRMTTWTQAATTLLPAASLELKYDLVGNVRNSKATHAILGNEGEVSSTGNVQDYWYLYDPMNRVTVSKGTGALGLGIGVGNQGIGVLIAYDKAGQRKTATRTISTQFEIMIGDGSGYHITHRNLNTVEEYGYDPAGYMTQTWVTQDEWSPEVGGPPTPGPKRLRADYTRDAMGRVAVYREYDDTGAERYTRGTTYNVRGQVETDTVVRRVQEGSGALTVYTDATINFYKAKETYTGSGIWRGIDDRPVTGEAGGSYMGGAVTYSETVTSKVKGSDSTSVPDTSNRQYLTWWDGTKQHETVYDSDIAPGSSNALWETYYNYDGAGVLTSANIYDGQPRTASFLTDASGMILKRTVNWAAGGNPTDIRYIYGGVTMGEITNDGTSNVDFGTAFLQHLTTASSNGVFRPNAGAYADFDQNYSAVNGNNFDVTSDRHVVQAGESLQSIALSTWGDANLWYLIAEANGLSASSQLTAGQSLIIPNKIANIGNSSETFRPYDPNEALGNLSPTAPKPTKKPKCGMMGQILVAVVAVAVAFALPELAPFFGEGIGLILGGMISSAVSQGVGIAIGAQNKFSWKSVAMAGITAGVGQGLQLDKLGKFGAFMRADNVLSNVVHAAASSAISQGIGVATGLQSKFSWAGVAAAGAAAGVSGIVGRSLGGRARFDASNHMTQSASLSNRVVSSAANAISNAATRSLVTGTSFGDNILAALPDIIANTLGMVVNDAVQREVVEARQERERRQIAGWSQFGDALPEEIDFARGAASQIDSDFGLDPGTALGRLGSTERGRQVLRDLTDAVPNVQVARDQVVNLGVEAYELAGVISSTEAQEMRDGIDFRTQPTSGPPRRQIPVPPSEPQGDGGAVEIPTGYPSPAIGAVTDMNMVVDHEKGPYVFGPTLDSIAINAGYSFKWIADRYESSFLLRAAVTVVSWATAPISNAILLVANQLGLSEAIDSVVEVAGAWAANEFTSRGYSAEEASAGILGTIGLISFGMAAGSAKRAIDAVRTAAGGLRRMLGAARDALRGRDHHNETRTIHNAEEVIRIRQQEIDDLWTPSSGFQAPAASNGRFTGRRGNSGFEVSDDLADRVGIPRGTVIPWRRGVPDFSQFLARGPGGMHGQFDVPGLTGDHGADFRRAVGHMAERTGMSRDDVKAYLSRNGIEVHHFQGTTMQLVPRGIHNGVHHSGSAMEMRGGN